MAEKKMIDLLHASNQEAVDVVLTDVAPEIARELSTLVVDEAISGLIGAVVGAVLPRFNGIWLNYKQNRFERNVKELLEQFTRNQQYIMTQMQNLEDGLFEKFRTEFLPYLLDVITDEPQLSKVDYQINGYLNLLRIENPNEDMALMFFRTIRELNELDLRILRMYANRSEDTYWSVTSETGIDDEQYRFVREKLVRLGMLQSKNEMIRETNLDEVIKYIKEFQKQSKAKNPKALKDPKVKKLSTSDNYYITKLGRRYLELIEPVS